MPIQHTDLQEDLVLLNILRQDKKLLASLYFTYLDNKNLDNNYDLLLSSLHPKEIHKLSTLNDVGRKSNFLLGRYSAKNALKSLDRNLNSKHIFIDNGVFQQPIISENSNFEVSISHCKNIATALAFPKIHPMAVDLEEINTQKTTIIKSKLTEKELNLIDNFLIKFPSKFTQTELYFVFWTTKEAVSKALKCGLHINFNVLEIKSLELDLEINIDSNYIKYNPDDKLILRFSNFFQYKAISYIYKKNYCLSYVLPFKSKVV